MIVRRGELFFLRSSTVENFPPLISILHEMLVDVFEIAELACSIELSVEVRPLIIRDPLGRIGWNGDLSRWA